ncbi:MAG TPA: sulfotransferase [Gemmataceae bacterium]|nr:sulfotransferase [Gemmataceae bacterium]
MTSITTASTPSTPSASIGSSILSSPPLLPDDKLLEDAQERLFRQLTDSTDDLAQVPVVFILGAPRTGSTAFYQGVARYLQLPYFTNLASSLFPTFPALTAPLQRQVQASIEIEFTSAYGKTEGAFQPSEASGVLRNWFGGGHPSQLLSTTLLPGKKDHLIRTMAFFHQTFGAPLVIKNAWNCFRIAALADALPRAFFVWIRRDLVPSALSDLAARFIVQGNPGVWNSATPANVEELRQLPYWAQVVENQFEFTRAIDTGLRHHATDRHAQIWYEDYLRDPTGTLNELARAIGDRIPQSERSPLILGRPPRTPRPYSESDETNLRGYVASQEARLASLQYVPPSQAAA